MKKAFIVFGLLIILVLIWSVGLWTSRVGKIKVTFQVAPSFSDITVDGKTVGGSSVFVSKGKHVFEAQFRDFTPDKETVDIKKSTTVTLSPTPTSEDDFNFLSDNPNVQRERESIAGEGINKDSVTLADRYPYMDQLPIETRNFIVSSGAGSRENKQSGPTIALYVTANSPVDRARALERIKSDLGIDLSTVEIIFYQTNNPFAPELPV